MDGQLVASVPLSCRLSSSPTSSGDKASTMRWMRAISVSSSGAGWRSRTSSARSATVCASNIARPGMSRSNALPMRPVTWPATSECPPRSKKLSCRDGSTPSTDAHTPAMNSSSASTGAAPPTSGSGSAATSTLPFAVSGTESTRSQLVGTM
ncbi:hypothetical protein C8054_09125 [Micromonospora sp. RP3T]|nr:hypothetical protein C8054_09125 [Micromonospora sp. RP3T]